MYKLKVISGPNRGTSYALQNGVNSIGRKIGNEIVLQSSKVSKQHCHLIIHQDEINVEDQQSANGTFVNGVLIRSRNIKPGDRISVGEFVFELMQSQDSALNAPPPVVGLGKLVPLPKSFNTNPLSSPSPASSVSWGGTSSVPKSVERVPQDFKEKIIWYFEKNIMPFFYGLNFRYEWRTILIAIFVALGIGNILISVRPLIESSRMSVVKEITRRAQFMAKQIADKNITAIANHAETTTDIGMIEREDGVRMVVITDLDSRIIAPPSKMNQYLTSGSEARLAVQAKKAFLKGRETGIALEADSATVVSIEPVKVYDSRVGKNVVIAMVIVSLDTTLSTLSPGEIGMIYSETLILNGLLLCFFFLVVYYLTLKPFQVLNDDMDKVLKGEMNQVTQEFKISEHRSLWDIVNSALQRIPRGSSLLEGGFSEEAIAASPEEFATSISMLGKIAKFGLVVCDSERKVLQLNSVFEEITGIRAEGALGQPLVSVARDQAFVALCSELFDRAPVGGGEIFEEFEFSGVPYKMHVTAFGPAGRPAKNYILVAERSDGGES